jgi:hypothetical protein
MSGNMSSLIFHTDETQVLVATDTLATHPDGRPFKFLSKAFIVPHLNLIMAGVGVAGVLSRWFVFMNEMLAVRGIDALNHHAPGALNSVWQGYKKELSIPDDMTATVYHFGFSEETGLIHAYAYRSAHDFNSDRLEPYGFRYKPEFPAPSEYPAVNLLNDLPGMMAAQRAVQAAKPSGGDKIYIGGEIQVHYLSKDGFKVFTLHRFDDYDSDEKAIYDNLIAAAAKAAGNSTV